jgi:superfamily II DNA or RNA helicase
MSNVWDGFKISMPPGFKDDEIARHFQMYGIYESLQRKSFALGLATGTGKTIIAISTLLHYRDRFPETKFIVLTKPSAIIQFREEFDKFYNHNLNIIPVYDGMPKYKMGSYPKVRNLVYNTFVSEFGEGKNIDGVVMGYPTLWRDKKQIYQMLDLNKKNGHKLFVIYDEALKFKGLKTKTFGSVDVITRKADRVLALTATLTEGKLEDTYAVFKGIGIQITRTKKEFLDEFCKVWINPKNFKVYRIYGYKNIQEFKRRIQEHSFSLTKEEVGDELPPFNIRKVYIEHSKEQKRVIRDIYNLEIEKDNGEYIEIIPLNQSQFIKRALQDERLINRGNLNNHKKTSPKTAEILRMLQEDYFGEKIIIYTQSKEYLQLLSNTISKTKDVPEYYKKVLMIHGDIPVGDRDNNKKIFESSDTHNIFIIDDAGIEALNLQMASTVIVATLPFTGGRLIQLAGRISRIGTKHKNLEMVYLLIENSQDEDEYLIVNQQMALMASTIGEAEKGLIDRELLEKSRKLTKEEIENNEIDDLILDGRRKRKTFYKRG